MLQAMAECHKNSIIHRDIKLDNFLVKKDMESGKTNVQLADFGIACKYDRENPPSARCGTREYVAPEVLSYKYGKECDIWSLGVCIYQLLTGNMPFNARDQDSLFKKISK